MDPNNPAQSQNSQVPPWKQPHIPISEAEMSHPEPSNGGRNTLLTLASLLVLACIVGITLYLYIQNRTTKLSSNTPGSQQNDTTQPQNNAQIEAIPTMTQEQQKETYGDVVCRRFTSIEEAIQVPEIACVLDLSEQNLTDLPEYITKLTKLNELNLSINKFSEFPTVLYEIKSLTSINLENNNLSSIPEDISTQLPSLQSIRLEGNNLSKEVVEKYQNLNTLPSPIPQKGSSVTPVKTSQ